MAAKKKVAEKFSAPKAPPNTKKSDEGSGKELTKAQAFLARIKKDYRDSAQIMMASESDMTYLKRLPSGILTLDLELRGGAPAAGITQLIGAKNAGKSYLAWQFVRTLQERLGRNMVALLAMTELRADRDQARKAGVKIAHSEIEIAKMEKARKDSGRPPLTEEELADLRFEIGEFHELCGIDGETIYDVLIEGVEADIYDIIIVDSIGNVMSRDEAEAVSVSKDQYGGSSKINTKLMHKLTPLLMMNGPDGRPRDPFIFGINQIRDAIGDPHKEYKAPGGNALAHGKLVDIFCKSGKRLGHDESVDTHEGKKQKWVDTGKVVNWKIEKGKAGMHEGGAGSYLYHFATNSADFYSDTITGGLKAGVILQSGSWHSVPDPLNQGKFLLRENSRDNFLAALVADAQQKFSEGRPNESVMRVIHKRALESVGVDPLYGW